MKPLNLTNETFATQVLESDRPVLVDFWADWCGPCKMMNPVLNEIAEEAGDRFTVAKVNVDEAADLAARYAVQSIPTLIVFRNGREAVRLIGLKPKAAILQALEAQEALA